MNTTEENRALIDRIFAELARDNGRPFVEALADDVRWTTAGKSVWSRSFPNKESVFADLLAPVRAQLVSHLKLKVSRLIADADHVVVEATGHATTKLGLPYDNEYCFVYRIAGGKITEVIEYMDTALACEALEAPWASATKATT